MILTNLIEFSLRNRLLVLAVSLLIFAYGAFQATRLPIDVFPDLNRPTVTVLTETAGLAPEEVEALVSIPLESSLNGAPGVLRVRASCGIGQSILYIEFDWGTDIHHARRIVEERIRLAQGRLPEGISPQLGPVSSIMGEILLIGITSKDGKTSPMALRTFAEWQVRPQLLSVRGVSQVIAMGGEQKQFQVLLSPQKMASHGITISEVEEAVAMSQANTPGGFLDFRNQELLVRNIGRSAKLEDLANTVIAERNGEPVMLDQVSEVRFGARVKRGDAGVDGERAVILTVQKQPGVDTTDLTQRIEKTLDSLQALAAADIDLRILFKQATFIETAVHNVAEAVRDGTLMVVLVLVLFLLNFRTTFITLTAIPFSFAVTTLYFHFAGISINTMTLGGLVVAVGMVVDDAIVDVENVFRRLRENRQSASPRPTLRVIADASTEVRNSMFLATLLVVLAFIPLFSLSGVEGRLFAPIGVATIVAMTASFLVSLTLIPVLCSYLLPGLAQLATKRESWLVRTLKWIDLRLVLSPALKFPAAPIVLALGLIVVSLFHFLEMGRELLPEFNEGTAVVFVAVPPGTSLAESNRIGSIAERTLLEVPEIVSTGRRTGRAEMDEHAAGVETAEIDIELRPSDRTRAEILTDVRDRLGQIPGIGIGVGQPVSHRLDHILSGVRAQIAIKIFGPELPQLRASAKQVESLIEDIDGLVDLQVERLVLIPQVHVRIDRDKARLYGVNVGKLSNILEVALGGHRVTQIIDGQQTFDVFLRYEEDERHSVDAIRNTLVDTAGERKVPLSLLADVQLSKGPNEISRENVMRRIVVSGNVSGRDLSAVVEEIQSRIGASIELPEGYFFRFEGQFESQQQAARLIGILSAIVLVVIFVLLFAYFRSVPLVLQVMLNIPLALIGGVLLNRLLVGAISVASLIGMITLAGIASRNTIMMISHYLHLMKHEGETFGRSMIIRGSLERLVPVTMTALTAGLALIPLVLAAGDPGKEILHPLAVVIVGGLISSTLLDMAVTPAVFYLFGRKASKRWLQRGRDPLEA
ncbi:MAG TPA: efflux RND transporter permease subunit [Verrucomicrobiales bacterium]|nr:efflux RND transporter permease subunit [Verrucomicrobiales bacterium]